VSINVTVVVQLPHTKNNINSIHFNNNVKIKSNYNFKWHGHKTRPSIHVRLDTPIRGMCPFLHRILWALLQFGAPFMVVFSGHSCASGCVRVVIMFTGSCCCSRNLSWIRGYNHRQWAGIIKQRSCRFFGM